MTKERTVINSLATLALVISVAPASATASVDLQASVASKLANLQSAIRDGAVRFEPVVSQTRALKLASDCPNGYGRMYNDGKCHKGFAQ